MRALFIITSPLQYLNACEALAHYQIDREGAFLGLVPSRKHPQSLLQVQLLFDQSLWTECRVLEGLPPARLADRPRLLREWQILMGAWRFRRHADGYMKRIGRLNGVFLGDWRARSFRYFAFRNPRARIFLLDDGSIAHQTLRFRNDPRDPLLEANEFPTEERHNWKLRLAGIPFHDPETLTFFTSYQLAVPRRDQVERHQFDRLRRRAGEWRQLDETWLIGSNHPENGISTYGDYFRVMRRVRRFFGERKVRYFAHRGENDFKLRQLGHLGFAIERSELPLEVYIQQNGHYPRVLAAIASSVVDNLSIILGSRVGIFLFLAGPKYYRKKQKHLDDIVAYHRRALGGNLHVIHWDQPSVELSHFEPIIHKFWALTADGVQSCGLEARFLIAQSGATARPVDIKNSGLRYLLLPFAVPDGGENRGAGVPRTWPRPAEVSGRTHWILLEGASENVLPAAKRRELPNFEGVGCSIDRIDPSSNVLAPDGSREVWHVRERERDELHRISWPEVRAARESVVSFSLYVRRAGREAVRLRLVRGGSQIDCYFDLARGVPGEQSTAGSAEALDPHVEALGEQWYRIGIRGVLSDAAEAVRAQVILRTRPGGSFSRYRGDGYSGIYLFGPQLGTGSTVPTFWVPRRGAAPSRPPDSINITPAAAADSLLALMRVAVIGSDGETPLLEVVDQHGRAVRVVHRLGRVVAFGDDEELMALEIANVPVFRVAFYLDSAANEVALAVEGTIASRRLHHPLDRQTLQLRLGAAEPARRFMLLVEEIRISRTPADPAVLCEFTRTEPTPKPAQVVPSTRKRRRPPALVAPPQVEDSSDVDT